MERLKPAAAAELVRMASVGFVGFDCNFLLEELVSRSWASATFTGARHEIAFRLEGLGASEAADMFLANLGEAEFELRGHIVADIALLSEERFDGGAVVRIRFEALTVEES